MYIVVQVYVAPNVVETVETLETMSHAMKSVRLVLIFVSATFKVCYGGSELQSSNDCRSPLLEHMSAFNFVGY